MKIKEIALCALFTALLIISTFIKIPLQPVSFTFQLFFVILAGLVLSPTLAFISVTLYMVLGLIGLPIFSGGGGLGYIFHPSFGYIIGFCISAVIVGIISKKPTLFRLFLASFTGMITVYLLGMGYYYFIINHFTLNMDLWKFLYAFCFIFIPFDIIKCILATLVAKRVRTHIKI